MAPETLPVALELVFGDEGAAATILITKRLGFRGAPKEECDASNRASEDNRMDCSSRRSRFYCVASHGAAALKTSLKSGKLPLLPNVSDRRSF
jgi:hypothetical protein